MADEIKTTKVAPKTNTTGKAEQGDSVKVHYTGTLGNGEQFDSSAGKDPLEFVVGQHQVIKGFEDAVLGMKPGEKKKVTIPVDEAYGKANPDLVQKVPREAMGDLAPEEGMMLAIQHPQMPQPMPAKILKVEEKEITLDLNHPLANEDLTFEIELVSIQ